MKWLPRCCRRADGHVLVAGPQQATTILAPTRAKCFVTVTAYLGFLDCKRTSWSSILDQFEKSHEVCLLLDPAASDTQQMSATDLLTSVP